MIESVKTASEDNGEKVRFSAEIKPDHRAKLKAIAGVRGISMSEQLRRWIEGERDPRPQRAAA